MPTGAAGNGRGRDGPPPYLGVGFLLSQLGADSSARFAQRLAGTGLSPPEGALLRVIAAQPGRSQQALAGQLRVAPSRVVALLDALEAKGLVARRRNATDRRLYSVDVTAAGRRSFGELRTVGMAHENEICEPLNADQRTVLIGLLSLLADHQGLAPGVHPGESWQGASPTAHPPAPT
jgi:DNA-binding MarR family transcriptional regulator